MRCACTSIPHALAVVCVVACYSVLLALWCFGIFGHFFLQFPERYSSCLSSFLAFWHWCVWAFFSEHLFSLGVSQSWWLGSGGSTPSDKGWGSRSSTPRDKGEGGSRKNFFSVWTKNKGDPSPRSATAESVYSTPPPYFHWLAQCGECLLSSLAHGGSWLVYQDLPAMGAVSF